MHRLIAQDARNAERVFPYIGGDEINSSPTHAHHRYVIDFGDMSEDEARRWPDLMDIVEHKVKPERLAQNDRYGRECWWRFLRTRPEMRQAIAPLDRVLAISRVTEHIGFVFLATDQVYSDRLCVIALASKSAFACLQSRAHEVWCRFFGHSHESRMQYTPSAYFETFAFPCDFDSSRAIGSVGETYYAFRAELMVARDKGLTRTYNDFHDRRLRNDPAIQRLRELHHAMDQAVLRAYGWEDLARAAAPDFLHEENEDEVAYQGRLFWPSDFRDEVLARLLALNGERHADEVRRGVAPRGGGRVQATETDAEDEETAA